KQNTRPIPAPSTPRLFSNDGLNDSRNTKVNSVYMTSLFLDDDDINSEIRYDELELGRKLGAGGFKDCYAGKYRGEPVAIGELRVTNFIRFVGVCTHTKHLCIVTELCENGDLFDYMRKVPIPDFSRQIMFMHDISLGVTYLHTRRPSIIHRVANASIHTQCGTPNWQAPEFWQSNPSYPYQNFSEHQLYEAVRDRGIRPPIDSLLKHPQLLLDLVTEMWQKESNKRPSMGSVVDRLAKFLS
ncbi:3630_t:CDS:2, partial [Diversispora eburnea]